MILKMTKWEAILGKAYFLFQFFLLPWLLALGSTYLPVPLSDSALNAILFFINFLAVWGIFHKFLWHSLKYAVKRPVDTLIAAGMGFGIYYLGNILVSYLILFLSPDFFNVNDSNIAGMAQENYFLVALCVVVLVPVVEEVFYRGLIFGRIYSRNKWAGYIISVLCFAFIHIAGYIGLYDWKTLGLCLIQYIPAGIGLAFAYQKSQTIWTSVLIHALVNLTGILAMR